MLVVLPSGVAPTLLPLCYYAAVLETTWKLEEARRRRKSGVGTMRRSSGAGATGRMIGGDNKEEDKQ